MRNPRGRHLPDLCDACKTMLVKTSFHDEDDKIRCFACHQEYLKTKTPVREVKA